MSAQLISAKTQKQNPNFTALDVVGVSLSTLLFTLVWVSVFSIFLPERSDMVFSRGLEKLSAVYNIDLVKAGDNAAGMLVAMHATASETTVREGSEYVLGASTSSVGTWGNYVLSYSVDYLNLLTFGLFENVNPYYLTSSITSVLQGAVGAV